MADMWNGVADAWERNAEHVDRIGAPATRALLDAARIGPGAAVLEVACGPGGAGLAAAGRVGEDGRVVLSDVAPAMVEAATRRARGHTQVSTAVFDQATIDAPDESFDAVICRHGLMFLDVPADAVREARRVLRSGGTYATVTWDARGSNPWLGIVLDAVGEQFGTSFPPPGIPGPFSLDDPATLGDVLRAGGLEDIEVTRAPAPMRVASLEDWWEVVPQLAGPLAIALAAMEPAVRTAIRDRALAYGREACRTTGDGLIELAGSALVASGRRGG